MKQISWLFLPSVLLGVIVFFAGCDFFPWRTSTPESITHKTIYSFLGAPGSGKGTLAEMCATRLGYLVLSTGNLCRQHIAAHTTKGTMLEQYTKVGKLVPDETIIEMVDEWLGEHAKTKQPIILDGFPRTKNQAKLFIELLQRKFSDFKLRIVELGITDDEIVKRIVNRLVCSNKKCQATYNRTLLKDQKDMSHPVCPACGFNLVRREDDNENVVRDRLKIYAEHHRSLSNFYKESGIPIEHEPVGGLTTEQMFENFQVRARQPQPHTSQPCCSPSPAAVAHS